MDYHPLRPNGWKLQEPDPEPQEEQELRESVAVDVVYNVHDTEGKSKTIALKVSLQLPLQ